MAPLPDYVTGTITLTNGSPNFTGDGTGWLAAGFREGDTILGIEDNEGVVYVIESITDNDAGTLTQDWQGATGTYAYRMRYLSDGQRVTAQARQLIELLGNGNLQAVAGLPGTPQTLMMFTGPGAMVEVPRTDLISGAAYDVQVDTLADRDAYDSTDAGFAVLVSDVGDGRAAIYSKLSNTTGDWSDPAYVTGPIAEVTVGTTTTGAPGTPASVTGTPTVGGIELDFTIPAGEGFSAEGDYSGSTAYVKGDVVQYQGSSWIALQATTGNTPPSMPTTSNAYWQLLARAGNDGAGTVTTLVAGDGIFVDSTDPTEPVVALDVMGESVKTANYTLVAADYGGTFIADDTDPIEFAFEAATTLGAKWWAVVKNIGAGDLTLNPDGSETIDGEDTLVLEQGQSCLVTCNGAELRTVFRGGGSVEQLFEEDLTSEFDATQKAQARHNIGVEKTRISIADFDNSNPMFIAHRNQAQLYPDQSLGAFRASAASPYVHALECDVRELSDGTLVCFHDTTVDRVTSSTGNVEDLDADGFRALYIDGEIWHGSNVADGHQVAFFEDVLREFKGKKLFAIEIKTSGAGQAVIDALDAAGIAKDQAVVSSFTLSDLTPVVSSGYPAMLNTGDDSAIAAAQSAGVTWVAINKSASDSAIEAWVNAGFKTVSYTVRRRFDRDRLLALGVIGFYADDVEYLARNTPMATRDTFDTGMWMPGMLAIGDSLGSDGRGRILPDGSWGWPDQYVDDSTRRYVLQGWAGPITNAPDADRCSITFNVKYGARDTGNRWVSVYITDESIGDREIRDDGTDTYACGYNVLFSTAGNLTIYRVDDGVPTQIAVEATGLSRPDGTDCRYRVTVTPTEIIAEQLNPDGSVLFDVSAEDDTYRGGYFHFGRRQMAAQFSDVEVSFGEAPAYAKSGQSLTGQAGNAHVVRHADGTQECWGRVDISPVADTPTAVTVTFPLPFVDTNYVALATAGVTSTVYLRTSVGSFTTSTVDVIALRTNTTTTNHSWYVRGRWK